MSEFIDLSLETSEHKVEYSRNQSPMIYDRLSNLEELTRKQIIPAIDRLTTHELSLNPNMSTLDSIVHLPSTQ
ncbi:hypothetical protein ACFX19_041216 [Malus domestica]